LWDSADGNDRGLIGKHGDLALGVSFTKDGSRLATTGRDRTLRVWDLEKRTEQHAFRPSEADADEAKIVHAIAYSPDGSMLAVAEEGGTITLWNVKEHKRIGTLARHTGSVNSLAWSIDSARLVSASGDKTAIIWDTTAMKPIQTRRDRRFRHGHPTVERGKA
jgi:WD40 repeat protein